MFEQRLERRKKLKEKLRKRERVFGGWISYREPAIAETFAKAGLDFVAIDMEHKTISESLKKINYKKYLSIEMKKSSIKSLISGIKFVKSTYIS